MRELTRNELAICKRTAKSTKQLRDKKVRISAKIESLEKELAFIEESIEIFEAPIKHLTGGFTSEEVLNGAIEVAAATNETPEGEVDETANVELKEVPAEEAVAIDPNVKSPLEEEVGETPWGANEECGTDTTAAPFCENNVEQN